MKRYRYDDGEAYDPEKVLEVSMHSLNLKKLPKTFVKLINVKEIHLSSNSFTNIPVEIAHLPNVELLNLHKNNIHRLQFDFVKLPKLKELLLGKNHLKKLPSNFIFLTTLEDLDLENNQLSAFPEPIESLKKLKRLDLSGNKITHVPKEIGNLIHLKSLNLRGNPIKHISTEIQQLQGLEKLWMDTSIDDSMLACLLKISTLEKLEIGISSNLNFADGKDNWRFLRSLTLIGNKQNALPPSVGQLPQLFHLTIKHFGSADLPQDIGLLHNLRTLEILQTSIKNLPSTFYQLQSLRILKIKSLQNRVAIDKLVQLKSLRQLELRDGKIAKKIIHFIELCRKKLLPDDLKVLAFKTGIGAKTSLAKIQKRDLFILLNFPFQQLENNVRNHILNNHNLGFKNAPLKPETHLAILGKTNLNFKKIKPHLKNISKKITPQTTHVVLGKLPGEIDNLAFRDFVFVRESDLNLWVQQQENPYLLNSSEAEVENLSRLLLSFQEENIEIVLQIIKTGGVPTILLTDLVIVFKKLKTGRQKRVIRKLLSLHLSEAALRVVSLKTGLLKAEDLEKKILELTDETVLDGLKISKYLSVDKK